MSNFPAERLEFQFLNVNNLPLQTVHLCKLLVFGHRSLIKYKTNSGGKHFKNTHFTNLKFRMLVEMHFLKYNR